MWSRKKILEKLNGDIKILTDKIDQLHSRMIEIETKHDVHNFDITMLINEVNGLKTTISDINNNDISYDSTEEDTISDEDDSIVSGSRRPTISKDKISRIIDLYQVNTNNYTEIARIVGVSRTSVRKYVNEYKEIGHRSFCSKYGLL